MNIGTLVARRQPVQAEQFNALVADLRAALNVRTGPGLHATWNEGALSIVLTAAPFDWFVPARIDAVTGGDPDFPANVLYTATGIFEKITLTQVPPDYGRPVKGADKAFTKVRPAKVGSLCYIIRDRDVEGVIKPKLALFQGGDEGECVFYEQCDSGPAARASAEPTGDRAAGGRGILASIGRGVKSALGRRG